MEIRNLIESSLRPTDFMEHLFSFALMNGHLFYNLDCNGQSFSHFIFFMKKKHSKIAKKKYLLSLLFSYLFKEVEKIEISTNEKGYMKSLEVISRKFKKIKALRFFGKCSGSNAWDSFNKFFSFLNRFENLKELNMGGLGLEDKHIESITKNYKYKESLEALDLSENLIKDSGLKCLTQTNFKNLSSLNLSRNKLTGNLEEWGLDKLTSLEINLYQSQEEVRFNLGNFPNLRNLNMEDYIYPMSWFTKKESASYFIKGLAKISDQLEKFNLNYCKHFWDFFGEIFSLRYSSLRELNLKRLQINKSVLKLIETNCVNLEILKMDECKLSNSLSGDEAINLPKLILLDLVSSDLGNTEMKSLSKWSLSQLTHLNLSNNTFTFSGGKYITKMNLTKLKHLSMSNIPRNADAIHKYLINMNELQTLDVSSNKFTSAGLKSLLANYSSGLPYLTNLDLSSNQIGDDGAKLIAIGKLKSLKYLNLENNLITLKGLGFLFKLNDLEYLNLKLNDIGDDETEEKDNIANIETKSKNKTKASEDKQSASKTVKIQKLILENNKISSENLKVIFKHSFPHLRVLNLKYNNIQDSGVQFLMNSTNVNKNLLLLELDSNELTNKSVNFLSTLSENFTKIKKLTLWNNNNITEKGKEKLKSNMKCYYEIQ